MLLYKSPPSAPPISPLVKRGVFSLNKMLLRFLLLFFLPFPIFATSLAITGTPETIFHYESDHCKVHYNEWQQGKFDFSDEPARAFIGSDGKVQLYITNSHGLYRSIGGTSLNSVFHRDCHPVLSSDYQNIGLHSHPSQLTNQLWFWALWKDPKSQNIYALVHNEFHGEKNPRYCSGKDKNNCWYSNLIAAVSHNDGKTFEILHNRYGVAPAIVSNFPYRIDGGRQGMPNASNIVKNFFDKSDSHFYVLALNMNCGNAPCLSKTDNKNGMCLFRADNIYYDKPTVWKAYDLGSKNFVRAFNQSPYQEKIAEPVTCTPVLPGLFRFGLSYNTALHEYIAVGLNTNYPTKQGPITTVVYAISRGSLSNWDTGPRGQGYCIQTKAGDCMKATWMKASLSKDIYSLGYPTLLDPESGDVNFQLTGKQPYLYFTTYLNQGGFFNRDVVRVPLRMSKDKV